MLRLDAGPKGARGNSDSDPVLDAEVIALVEPDPTTMDLADATRVLAGGAGLVPRGATDAEARALFGLLADVAGRLGASMGATRVATDAGWAGHERQIGTTGVTVDPDLYVAFGVSGATQHTGGLGSPRHTVSVNIDPSCPMTAMADLGLVADATGLLVQLAGRLGVPIPPEVAGAPLTRATERAVANLVATEVGPAGREAAFAPAAPDAPPTAADPDVPTPATDPARGAPLPQPPTPPAPPSPPTPPTSR
jgi:electron transfer flavoprotein alpha subunit